MDLSELIRTTHPYLLSSEGKTWIPVAVSLDKQWMNIEIICDNITFEPGNRDLWIRYQDYVNRAWRIYTFSVRTDLKKSVITRKYKKLLKSAVTHFSGRQFSFKDIPNDWGDASSIVSHYSRKGWINRIDKITVKHGKSVYEYGIYQFTEKARQEVAE